MTTPLRAIYAIYPDPDAAERAYMALQVTFKYFGTGALQIEVLSSEPFEEYEFGRPSQRTSIPWIAALGGLVGGVCGYLLTWLTQTAYPLPTGGMPLSPHWTNGIITYEMTMLGAIVATIVTLAVTTRVPGRRSSLADPAIADGKIVVGVRNVPASAREEIERALRSAGADSVVCHN
jgi:hypothetical protein